MGTRQVKIAPSRSALLFAFATVAMIIMSYVIVIALAAACAYLPYLVLSNMERANFQLLALMVGGVVLAGAILWSLVPKRIEFAAPGLLLERHSQPKLFSEIDAIAEALNEPTPSEVYLIGPVNAFVAERGGFIGFGTKRILAVGLPLFATMTVSEMRGVLAHEFAHYYGGDTRVGPFVYRVKDTIIRTFENIKAVGAIGRVAIIGLLYTIVVHLLSWYFKGFLRAINFVSRKQEFRADELACYVAGGEAMAQGLRKLGTGSLAWHYYWQSDVAPVLAENAVPPIGEGFARLFENTEIANGVKQAAEAHIAQEKTEPYDTHPPTRDRLAAIERLQIPAVDQCDEPALGLLNNSSGLEIGLLAAMNKRIDARKMRTVEWSQVSEAVTVPSWQRTANDYAPVLRGTTVEKLPELLRSIFEFSKKLPDPSGFLPSTEQRMNQAKHVIGVALALNLVERGWRLRQLPGTFFLELGDAKLNPLEMAFELGGEELKLEKWKTKCEELGVAGQQVWLPTERGASGAV